MNEYVSQKECTNKFCSNCGKIGDAFVAAHDKKGNRLRCRLCSKTWSVHYKEFHYGLRSDLAKIRRALDLLKVQIPIRKIAEFVKVSPSTVMRWKKKFSGKQ